MDYFPEPGAKSRKPLVRWRWEAKENKVKSKEAGHPVHELAPWITIRIPGDSTFAIDHFATPEELEEYAVSFEAFKRKESSEGIVGMLLEEWPLMSRARVEDLKHFGVRTVEQAAALTDANCRNVPRGLELRNQARAYLEAAKASAPVAKLADENKELRNRIETLERQLQETMASLDKATEPKRKG